MQHQQSILRQILSTRFQNLRIRYPSYSLRAFAKKAGLSPATMSLLLKGKRKVSSKLILQLSERLRFDPQERAEVIEPSTSQVLSQQNKERYIQLTVDQYQLIADWRAFALLNLIKTASFKNDPKWLAGRMALPVQEVQEVLEHLKRLNLVKESKGSLKRVEQNFRTTDDVANMSLKQSHFQTLELAQKSLDRDSIEDRDFTWVTFAFDKNKMELAKTMIRKFQDELLSHLETNSEPDEVYRMSIQLFPLTTIKQKASK